MTQPEPGKQQEQTTEPTPEEVSAPAAGEVTTGSPERSSAETPDAPHVPFADPQAVFAGLSLASLEADLDALMSDKMGELDGMLAGLEQLVERLEGEVTQLEKPSDDSA
ncbi:hypothetical protein [Actinosynnema sp.]|uniref:hypothetical protein n=1 Tax=Actinosynnema sp. TaxID=1872144 RepID=UPI003F870A98